METVFAYSSTSVTIYLVVVFFVVFPALLHGLIAFAAAQAIGERAENQEYLEKSKQQRTRG